MVYNIGEADKKKNIMDRLHAEAVLSAARGLFIAKLRIWTMLLETWLVRVGGEALGAAIRESVRVEEDWMNEYACRTRRARLEAALEASMMDASSLAREEQAYRSMKEAQGAVNAAKNALHHTNALLAVPSHYEDDYEDDSVEYIEDDDEADAGGDEEEEDAATVAEMVRPLNLNREHFEAYTRLVRHGLRAERRREEEQEREARRRLSNSSTNNYYHQHNNNNDDDAPINLDFAHRLGFM